LRRKYSKKRGQEGMKIINIYKVFTEYSHS